MFMYNFKMIEELLNDVFEMGFQRFEYLLLISFNFLNKTLISFIIAVPKAIFKT